MAATELNFGPEWLRALSDGASKSVTSNSSSSNSLNNNTSGGSLRTKMVSKSSSTSSCSVSSTTNVVSSSNKQANDGRYRYSKREMLSFYEKSSSFPPPKDLQQHEEVFVEDIQNPLSINGLTSDEMNLISQSINSDFVLKKSNANLMGAEHQASADSSGGGNGTPSGNSGCTYKDPLNRMKLLNLNSVQSDMLTRNSSSSSLGERGKHGTNGFNANSERNPNSYQLRSGGGRNGPTSVRSAARGANNIVFTRFSSIDDATSSAGGSCAGTAAGSSKSVFIPKKGSGLQRSSENNSVQSSSNSSLFMPWRTGSTSANPSSNHNGNGDTKEWKSSNVTNISSATSGEVLKSWRNDMANNNFSSTNSKIGALQLPHKERKDFFSDPLDSSDHEVSGSRKTGRNLDSSSNSKQSKSFNRRFSSNSSSSSSTQNNDQIDSFKTESGISNNHGSQYHHHRDHHPNSHDGSLLDAERDLFGGRSTTGQSSASANNYGDLLGVRSAISASSSNHSNNPSKTLNRYTREHARDVNVSSSYSTDKFNSTSSHYSTKTYDRDRSNNSAGGGGGSSYHQRSHQFESRFTRSSNNQGDDGSDFFMDRFGARSGTHSGNLALSSDDDDYRRNSLPEWSLEDPSSIDVTRVGTFDASGAFHEALDDDDDGSDFFRNATNQICNSDQGKDLESKDEQIQKMNPPIPEDSNSTQPTTTENSIENKKVPNPDSRLTDQLTQLRLETSQSDTGSKPKIDYFNDPSLSPNYHTTRENTKLESKRHADNERESTEENSMFRSKPLRSDVTHRSNSTEQDINRVEKKINAENEDEDRLCKQYNSLLMKTDDSLANFDPVRNQSNCGNGSFMNESKFGPIISDLKPTISSENDNAKVSQSLLAETDSSTYQSASLLFNSFLNNNKHVENNNDRLSKNATSNQMSEDLLGEQLKLSSFLSDFAFDFGGNATGSSSSSVSVPVKNHTEQLFQNLASSTSNSLQQANTLNMASSFINPNPSASQTFPSSAGAFEAGNLLNFADNSNSAEQSPFIGANRFPNLMSQSNLSSSGQAIPIKQQVAKGNMEANRDLSNNAPSALLMTKWFYCDPQGQTQGPFTNQEMFDWYNEKYFSLDLLVKRASDPKFTELGELIQACGGRCPFVVNMSPTAPVATPSSPPLVHEPPATDFTSVRNESSAMFSNFIPNRRNAASSPPTHPVSAATQQQSQTRSAPIVPPMMNHFMHTQGQSLSLSTPTNLSPHSLGSNTNSFPMDDPIINPFGFFQNLKPDSTLSMNMNCPRSTGTGSASINENENILSGNDQLIDIIRQNQSQLQSQTAQSAPPPIGRVPPNCSPISQESQMRLFLNNLMQQQQPPPPPPTQQVQSKDDFLALNTQTREQYLIEKFPHYNLAHNKDQLRQALNEQYHLNHCLQTSSANTTEIVYHSMDEDQLTTASSSGPLGGPARTPKKLTEDSVIITRSSNNVAGSMPIGQSALPVRAQSYEQTGSEFEKTPPVTTSFQLQQEQQRDPDSFSKEDPLQLLKKYAANNGSAGSTGAPWIADNFVPGALSVTDVEEIQRREAEEHYRNQQQQKTKLSEEQDYVEGDNNEFIEVDRKQKHRQQQQAKQQNQKRKEPVVISGIAQSKPLGINQQVPQQISPQAQSTSPPSNSGVIPQMPQLPKKAVWGNPSTIENTDQQQNQSQPLSIAEIQRLQEEKEEEERRQREIQQMNALIQQQQQQQQRSMKWASQPWQEQSQSNVKTLAEIQAEEAEKQATLMRQQHQQETLEAATRRRAVAPITPLSVIVAKGGHSQSQAWNQNSSPKSVGAWGDDQEDQHQVNQSTSGTVTNVNYKNAVAANQKTSLRIDSGSLRQVLKTNPKVIRKVEDSQMMKVTVENHDELLRFSIDLLNNHFDSIDASGFVSILRDLGSPSEVSEYCQAYLGNNPASMFFSKFFITKKSILLKMKQQQEQERNKSQPPSKKNSNASSINQNEGEDDGHQSLHRVNNYKSALNNNAHSQFTSASSVKNFKNDPPNRSNTTNSSTSAHIKAATLKTISNKSKTSEDVNLMTIQVESMEEFDKWCLDVLKLNFELNIDAETFISFLKDIASPDEISDYVQTYLGSNKTSRDFAKNFISKRSYLRNKAKQNEPYEDMCGPAPALTPLVNFANNDNNGFVTVSSSNKKKRSKNKNQNHQNE